MKSPLEHEINEIEITIHELRPQLKSQYEHSSRMKPQIGESSDEINTENG